MTCFNLSIFATTIYDYIVNKVHLYTSTLFVAFGYG